MTRIRGFYYVPFYAKIRQRVAHNFPQFGLVSLRYIQDIENNQKAI